MGLSRCNWPPGVRVAGVEERVAESAGVPSGESWPRAGVAQPERPAGKARRLITAPEPPIAGALSESGAGLTASGSWWAVTSI